MCTYRTVTTVALGGDRLLSVNSGRKTLSSGVTSETASVDVTSVVSSICWKTKFKESLKIQCKQTLSTFDVKKKLILRV